MLRLSSFCRSIPMFVLVVIFSTVVKSETLNLKYQFERPAIEQIEIEGTIYDRISMPNAPNSGEVDHPSLPASGAKILLPYGKEIDNIEIVTGDKHILGSDFFVEPVGEPFALSSNQEDIRPLQTDPVIYNMNSPLPQNKFVNTGVQIFRGYQVLFLQLHPVEYIPTKGEVSYYSEMSVIINLKDDDEAVPLLRSVEVDQQEISFWVDNKDQVGSYNRAIKSGSKSYDLLIITPSVFRDAFTVLKNHHDNNGVITEIHTLDQIGSNDPTSVRDYIRQEYQNNGIEYVIIGGDDDLIPAVNLYVSATVSSGGIVEYNMPCDFYFSCLDGTFNYDGDSHWGEPTDGEGGGDVDLFADVHVGRISANTVDEVNNLVNKTIAYLDSNDPYLGDIFLAGEQLRFGGMGEYGGYAMEEMVDASTTHGYNTMAFPSSEYQIFKLYDFDTYPYNNWHPSLLTDRINAGVHIVDHLGHSGPDYAMRTDTAYIRANLTNTKYCFMYAEGCSAGSFDNTDCWAEYVTTTMEHGAFGCIANSRLGLGSRSTAHPVHVFNREFFDAIYRTEEAKPQLGKAISDCRVDHIFHINSPTVRWNFYEINLFGDPSVAIKTPKCVNISCTNLPTEVPPNTEVTFEMTVTGIGEGIPLDGSGQIHYKIDNNAWEVIAIADYTSNIYTVALPQLSCGSQMEFYISAEEASTGRYYYPDPSSPCTVNVVTEEILVFEDDFETSQEWTFTGGLWERGTPQGQGGLELQYPVPDPAYGCNGNNVMGYNLSGDYENSLPQTFAISPTIDCSESNNTTLRFCRWLGVEQPDYDLAQIAVSSDGNNFNLVWQNHAVIADLEWQNLEYDISFYADNQSTVYVAWIMGPTDGGLVYCGWNIDDVRVISKKCVSWLCGDVDNNDETNVTDLVYLVNFVFKSGPAPSIYESGDVDGSGQINVADLTHYVNYVFKGGSGLACE